MSKFRIELDVAFDTEKEAKALLNLIEKFKGKTYIDSLSSNRDLMTIKTARYHECFHDEIPPKACGGYVNVDFDGEEVEHTYKVVDGEKVTYVKPIESDLIKDLKIEGV